MDLLSLAGKPLGQYHLKTLLGNGGMGAVYRAYQPSLKRDVAIKVVSSQVSNKQLFLERFEREAQTAASLQHPHIIDVYDFGTDGIFSYIVMPFLEGGSLQDFIRDRIEQGYPLPTLSEASTLLSQLASALDYAHSRGIIHRDIKPANVMFDQQGTAYLVDFGIAKIMDANTDLTQTGMPIGTPFYMPPEQWQGKGIVPNTDQYALAMMLYQMLTGQLPFEADSQYSLMHKHDKEMPIPVHTLRSDVPATITSVLERAMAKNPAHRFPTVSAFASAFKSAIIGGYQPIRIH